MKGIELARDYYLEYGKEMIDNKFPQLKKYMAAGLVGSGSECYGFDDEISCDHDFEPGFCIFIPSGVLTSKEEFLLEREYSRLPKEYKGYKRSPLNPVGGSRHGVIKTKDFYESKTGCKKGELEIKDWFYIPEHALFEATDGEIFEDNFGEFTEMREKLLYFPRDVRLKKTAGELLIASQSGQYNYSRCLERGETGGAQLAAIEFVRSVMHIIFLLNKKYMPYYKWSFRALREQKILGNLEKSLEYIISTENEGDNKELKKQMTEDICKLVTDELKRQKISEIDTADLEKQAYEVNGKIENSEIRNLHILFAVQ